MDSPHEFEAIKQILTTSPLFHVKVAKQRLIVTRRRQFAPRRGAFRLLLPHACAIVSESKKAANKPHYFVRPDSLAIFMAVMLLGAIAVEIFMDRATYPRDYPPQFIYGLTIFYIGGLISEVVYTRKQLRKLFDQTQP